MAALQGVIYHEGAVEKRAQWTKSWKPRYLRLYQSPSPTLLYFVERSETTPKGALAVVSASATEDPKPNCFTISTKEGGEELMCCATAADRDKWVRSITKCVGGGGGGGSSGGAAAGRAAAVSLPAASAAAPTAKAAASAAAAPRSPPAGATDPLSFLADTPSPVAAAAAAAPAKSPEKKKVARAAKPAAKPAAAAAAAKKKKKKKKRAPGGFGMFGGSRRKSYEDATTGDGLREAIKAGDKKAVARILERDPSLAKYCDHSGQSLLHIACLFNHSAIALALVKAGAALDVKNQQDETPLDVASVSLASKIKKLQL